MHPIYKFELTANGTTQRAYPIYKDDLAKDFEKESGQEFFRAKLSGNLTFERDDYTFIVAQAFDTQFEVEIFISYNAGQTWASYWKGTFWKTDCEFDGDAETVVVKPTVLDQYNDVLAGLDKEYNLIELAPQIVPVKADKRPMIQLYVPGQTTIGCFLSGMWWEQECEAESDTDILQSEYKFFLCKSLLEVNVSGNMTPQLPPVFMGTFNGTTFQPAGYGTQDFPNGDYIFRYIRNAGRTDWQIIRAADSVVMWSYYRLTDATPMPDTVTLTPAGGGATGNVTLYLHNVIIFARYVCDVANFAGTPTYQIPDDDIVADNRNYSRIVGYNIPETILFSDVLSSTPTQWGIYQPGEYYAPPVVVNPPEMFPVARNQWGRVSVWFSFYGYDWIADRAGSKQFVIRDAYPLASVISVLLGQIAPGITHDATTAYSQFLYGTNPISGYDQTLLITPKSNIITSGYDQPAQKAPITLKNVLDMLRDCFRCYWWIDSTGKFRIEHIKYFRNGGSYYGTPVVGVDLTVQKVSRNGKTWAFARDQYQFDKPELAARYQFGWMDDVTQLFEGYPIDIISKYVNPDNIEQIDIQRFTSDIDYILLNPSEISKDGFVLLAGEKEIVSVQAQADAGQTFTKLINVDVEPNTDVVLLVTGSGITQDDTFSLSINETVVGNVTAGTPLTINVDYPITSIRISRSSSYVIGSGTVTMQLTISQYILPYYNYVSNRTDHYLQNAYVAFCLLQQYYVYDMPATEYKINGITYTALGIKKMKTQQIRFPLLNDPDLNKLVKTNLGRGSIGKLSLNLSSRNANATLKYDTE